MSYSVKLVSAKPEPCPLEGTIFTTSGTFVVPKGIKSMQVFTVGGGATGEYGKGSHPSVGGGWSGAGGSGGYTNTNTISVTPGQELNITIAGSGGQTSVESCSSRGGTVSNGGSGGGCSGVAGFFSVGAGGSDGANGTSGSGGPGGNGQGTTTRAFGEPEGTLYAGGGGGGGACSTVWSYHDMAGGAGGAGGGGNGKQYANGEDGGVNTGGGGGGGFGAYSFSASNTAGGNGGSGIAIVRW